MAHMPGKPAAPHVNKAGQLERDIYDAKQTQELPGTQVRYEGQPTNGDVAVDEGPTTIWASRMIFSGSNTSAIPSTIRG